MSLDSWSKQEQEKIAELMMKFKLTRPQAIQKMQRMKQKNIWRPTDV